MPAWPWQTAQLAAFARPALGSAASAAAPASVARASAATFSRGLLPGVSDAIDSPGKVIRNQQRAVFQLRHIHRAADGDPGLLVEEAVGEHLGLVRRAVGL